MNKIMLPKLKPLGCTNKINSTISEMFKLNCIHLQFFSKHDSSFWVIALCGDDLLNKLWGSVSKMGSDMELSLTYCISRVHR